MSVLKKCCVCDGPVADGRCSWCGMPYQDEENRYHLNENLRDHLNHMSEKERQEFFRKQQSLYTQPGQQAQSRQQRRPQYAQAARNQQAYRPSSQPQGQRPAGMPPYPGMHSSGSQQPKTNLAGIIILIFILICIFGPFLMDLIFG